MNLRKILSEYQPYNEQERSDKALMLRALDAFPDVLTRDNPICHFTGSSWIVNPARTKILMAYHKIYQAWAWTGGHADGESDLCTVALREAREETGLERLRLLSEGVYGIQAICVDSHRKRGAFVSSHLHLDFCYLLEADEDAPLRAKPDENSGVAWIPVERVLEVSGEKPMLGIYAKLNERLRAYPADPG